MVILQSRFRLASHASSRLEDGRCVKFKGSERMLAKPKFFDAPSEARLAARKALNEGRLICSVNDVFTRVDPDEGKWFGIIVLDTDSLPTLLHARKQLPEFRVIGELVS
jgi:hypothetical protein